MAISHITDSTGTTLNRYTLTHSDSTTEVVTLDFNPSADYVAGTPYNAATINPIIDEVNNGISYEVISTL